MTQKTIKEVVNEFKEAFGLVEFKAVNGETSQVVASKGWYEAPMHRLKISAADYLALGNLGKGAAPADGVIAGLLKISKGSR